MKKCMRFLCLLLCLAAMLPTVAANAADAEGTTGSFTWSLTDGVLTITGEGNMPDYPDGAPWDAYKDRITKVVLAGGVTYVGAHAFEDYDKLEAVDFGDVIYELGKRSFYSCDGLTVLHLPKTFKVFGEECLRHCSGLKEIHSQGRPASFRLNCLWDTKVIIYFPASQPWGVDYIQEMEGVFKGRIEFRASDGTDPYDPNAVTTPPTTEPTTVPTTVPPTEAPTETVPAPTLPPFTQPPQTTPPVTTQPTEPQTRPTQPDEQQKESGIPGSTWIWLVVAVVFGILAMAIPAFTRPKRRKKRRRNPNYYD